MIEAFASDYAQDIAFELYVLARTTPLNANGGQTQSATMSLGSAQQHITIGLETTIGLTVQGAVVRLGLHPLLFGAAWKILDVLADHIMYRGMPPSRIQIQQKTSAAMQRRLHFSPLSAYADIEQRVWAAYANADQYRHSLIHRRASVAANGDFTGTDHAGATLRPLQVAEQDAFILVAQRVAASVATGVLQPREKTRLAAELDALTALTQLPPLRYPAPSTTIPRVTIPIQTTDIVDMVQVKTLVHNTYPGPEVDVIFEVTDRQAVRYLCALEDSPSKTLSIDENTLEPWLQPL